VHGLGLDKETNLSFVFIPKISHSLPSFAVRESLLVETKGENETQPSTKLAKRKLFDDPRKGNCLCPCGMTLPWGRRRSMILMG
jgi:hypothetical protein